MVKDDGLFVHNIDLSDEFSHTDKTISSINFLQFNDDEWKRIAPSRFMRMNRLRFDDYEELFRQSNHRIAAIESKKDYSALKILQNGSLTLDERFKGKSTEILTTVASWIVSEKCV